MANNKENFERLKTFFDEQEWHYTTQELEEDRYVIDSGLNGENIKFNFFVLFTNEDVIFKATLPMKFSSENIETLSVKIMEINSELLYGTFQYDFSDNLVYYSYRYLTDDIQLNDHLARNIIFNCCLMVDKFAKNIIQLA